MKASVLVLAFLLLAGCILEPVDGKLQWPESECVPVCEKLGAEYLKYNYGSAGGIGREGRPAQCVCLKNETVMYV